MKIIALMNFSIGMRNWTAYLKFPVTEYGSTLFEDLKKLPIKLTKIYKLKIRL